MLYSTKCVDLWEHQITLDTAMKQIETPIIGDALEEAVLGMPGCTSHAKDTIIAACNRADNAGTPTELSSDSPEGRKIAQFFNLDRLRELAEVLHRPITVKQDTGELVFPPYPKTQPTAA